MDNIRYNFSTGDIETAETLLRTLFRLTEIGRECVIPGIVKNYSAKTHYAEILPLVKAGENTTTGDTTSVVFSERPPVKVKVYQQRHGNFYFDFPINVGDTGFLVAVDRNWQSARQNNQSLDVNEHEGAQEPASFETASFANGIFVPFSFVNSKKSYLEPDEDDVRRVMRPLEMPDEATTIAVHEWKSPQEAILIGERQGNGFDIEQSMLFDSDSTPGDGVAGAILVGRGVVRLVGTGSVDRPTTLFVGGEGTVATNRLSVESLPKNGEQMEFHYEYIKADGTRTFKKKAVIDPYADLKESDAKFRELYFLGLADDSDSYGSDDHIIAWPSGVTHGYQHDSDHIWLLKARVLSDIPVKIRKIKLHGGGGGGGGAGSGDSGSYWHGDGGIADSYLYDASGSCSIVYDVTYDDQSDSISPPYTIKVTKGVIRYTVVSGKGNRKKLGLSGERGKTELRIPTVPISEVVHKWALKSYEEESESIEEDIPYYIPIRAPNGDPFKISIGYDSHGDEVLSVTPY